MEGGVAALRPDSSNSWLQAPPPTTVIDQLVPGSGVNAFARSLRERLSEIERFAVSEVEQLLRVNSNLRREISDLRSRGGGSTGSRSSLACVPLQAVAPQLKETALAASLQLAPANQTISSFKDESDNMMEPTSFFLRGPRSSISSMFSTDSARPPQARPDSPRSPGGGITPESLSPDASGALSDLPWRRSKRTSTNSSRPSSKESPPKRGSLQSQDSVESPPLGHFDVLYYWVQCSEHRPKMKTILSGRPFESSTDFEDAIPNDEETESSAGRMCTWQSLMVDPTSTTCIAWDSIGMGLITYDFIAVPMQLVGFPEAPHQQGFVAVMDWFGRIFWTASMPRSCMVGYVLPNGNTEMTPARVLRNYFAGWFAFDLLVVLSDWVDAALGGAEYVTAMRLVKAGRFLRILRVMRIMREAKLPAVMEELNARFCSERVLILFGIAKISLAFMGLAHIIACLWYGIGLQLQEDNHGLVASYGWVTRHGIQELRFWQRYVTSLHWSITQFVGTMEIHPQTELERSYAIVVLVFSFVVTAGFVSRITASLTRLQILAGRKERELLLLRQFLRNCKVSPNLAMRVMRSARFALDLQEKSTQEQDVQILRVISEPLRVEIHYELHMPIIITHPFFHQYHLAMPAAMRQMCHLAATTQSLHAGDILFSAGEAPKFPKMFFIVSGQMRYKTHRLEDTIVDAGAWACEAALWTKWVHMGDLEAMTECHVLALDALLFQQVSDNFQSYMAPVAAYAAKFVVHLNTTKAATGDLHDDSIDVDPRILMPRSHRHSTSDRASQQ
mmetsp:Transcript_113051/g.292319  ORF Transcript_113051/g.292319 Transcript_113051/m.292319 type:complete len:789 (+) Transcript_113051:134-2500(+)